MRQCLKIDLLFILCVTASVVLASNSANAVVAANSPAAIANNAAATATQAATNQAAQTTSQAVTDALVQKALSDSAAAKLGAAAGALGAATGADGAADGTGTGAAAEKQINTSDLQNPDSALFKANAMAQQRKQDKTLSKYAGVMKSDEILGSVETPPELRDLQNINTSKKAKDALTSADTSFLDTDMAKDMRKEAQRNAALSYGARGGLSKRSFQIMEKMDDYSPVLDKVFDFRSLLVKAPSGMMIEPPIIKESIEALKINDGGNEAAVADSILDINKNAKIVSAPRDWRQYLLQKWSSKVPPPPKVLWPQNEEEQKNWNNWVAQGWDAGIHQADQIFELNTNRLTADYRGMVRYRILLAQGMVSSPFTTQEDRGVVGDGNQMRIGDKAIRITEPSRFLTGVNNTWRPADQ